MGDIFFKSLEKTEQIRSLPTRFPTFASENRTKDAKL